MANIIWVTEVAQLENKPPMPIVDWLTKAPILSQALKRVCQNLTVEVVSETFKPAYEDEYSALDMPMQPDPFVRQVFLLGDGVRLTYGRVIIPHRTYREFFHQFSTLNTKFIGETLLYNNPDVTRGPFEYAEFTVEHPLAKEISTLQSVWGNRSVFHIKSYPLLVTSVLLPTLPAFVPVP